MAKRGTTIQSATRIKADLSPPRMGDEDWNVYWSIRGWEAPDRGRWTDPWDDRQLLLYSSSLRDKFGYIRFVGLPTQGGPDDTRIESLYVQPALSYERVDPNRSVDAWPASHPLVDAVINHPRLVILGDPGSGKSTLVSWIALSFLSREKNALKDAVGPLVPVALVLRDLNLDGVTTWRGLLGRLIESPGGQSLGSVEKVVSILRLGQCLVLIDGLDEAGGTVVRGGIAEALHEAFEDYPSVRWIITSRIVAYDEAAIETRESVLAAANPIEEVIKSGITLHVVETREDTGAFQITQTSPVAARMYVVPFDDARIAAFVRNWHEEHETERSERGKRSDELIKAINASPQVRSLARIPNLLTMIALVYRVYLRLPDGRALLYERIAQAYLETIETVRRLPTPGHTLEDMKRWLGYVAFQMQRRRFKDDDAFGIKIIVEDEDNGILVSRRQLTDWITYAMAKGKVEAIPRHAATAKAFVEWVARRAGLIIPRTEETFAFSHLSFQEYFAAWFLAEQVTSVAWIQGRVTPLSPGTELPTLQRACEDARWHETFTLLFELAAVRGDWADTLFDLVLRLDDASAWPDGSPTDDEQFRLANRALLLIALARDCHTGLSDENREAALHKGWNAWIALGRREKGTIPLRPPRDVASALTSPGTDGSRGLEALRTLPAPDRPAGTAFIEDGIGELVEFLNAKRVRIPWVHRLGLSGKETTDLVIAAMSSPNTGLVALHELFLWDTAITDEALKEMSQPGSGLATLSTLVFQGGSLRGEGLRAISRPDTALQRLATLCLFHMNVAEDGLLELARMDSGLKCLRKLRLSGTKVPVSVVQAFAHAKNALQELIFLDLSHSEFSDSDLAELASPPTSLGGLISLNLARTNITDAGMVALARTGAGMRGLKQIDVHDTEVTQHGRTELLRARPNVEFADLHAF